MEAQGAVPRGALYAPSWSLPRRAVDCAAPAPSGGLQPRGAWRTALAVRRSPRLPALRCRRSRRASPTSRSCAKTSFTRRPSAAIRCVHFTFFPDTGAVHFHKDVHGKVVAVPLDGTGPTYTGNFWESDTESIRAVKGGDLLVEQDTDFNHVVARGSDGSRVFFDFHAHFTVNANGETSVQISTRPGWSAPDSTPSRLLCVASRAPRIRRSLHTLVR